MYHSPALPQNRTAFFFLTLIISGVLFCLLLETIQYFDTQHMHAFKVEPSGYPQRSIESTVPSTTGNSSNAELQVNNNSEQRRGSFDPTEKYVTTLTKQWAEKLKDPQKRAKFNRNDLNFQLQKWTSDGFLYVRVMERYKDVLSVGGRTIYGTSNSHLDGAGVGSGFGGDASAASADGAAGEPPVAADNNNDSAGPGKSTEDRGSVVSLCGYEDYFNGTYLVQCPLYSRNVDVHIQTDPGEWIGKTKVKVKSISFRENIRVQSSDILNGQKRINCWLRKNSAWYWYDETSHLVDISMENFCKTLASFDRLYLIGSSHIRYQYSYLLMTCSHLVPDLRKRVIYIFALYGPDIYNVLNDMVESYSTKKCEGDGLPTFSTNMAQLKECAYYFKHDAIPDSESLYNYRYSTKTYGYKPKHCSLLGDNPLKLDFCRPSSDKKIGIMVETGDWDIQDRGHTVLNEKVTSELAQLFHKIFHKVKLTFGESNNMRMLVMGPPVNHPYDKGRLMFGGTLRNASQAHGVYFFPHAGMVLPKHLERVDPAHFITCKWRGHKNIVCQGTVGKDVARAAVIALDDRG